MIKALKEGFKYHQLFNPTFGGIPCTEIVNWLEKQGGIDNCPLESSTNTVITDSKKNQVEPKFKVGDWVISILPGIKYPHLITDIRDGYYIFGEDDDHAHIASNDNILKLWTIQDAKEGDVLVGVYGNIGIFEKRYGINWHTYCYLDCEGRFISEGGSHGSICYPATKEQCDLLFQKMHEAGWEFDFDKKELKKISQRMISAEVKETMYDKPTWSEEDNIILSRIIADYERSNEEWFNAQKSLPHGRKITWLKFLKERCTWKPDEEQLKAIKWIMDGDNPENWTVTLTNLYNDLKKLSQS